MNSCFEIDSNTLIDPLSAPKSSRLMCRILEALGNRRFLRAPLSVTSPLTEVVKQCILAEEPLPILLLWGKGPKCVPDRAEHLAGDLLCRYANSIEAVWPRGVRYSVLLADTHASANGYEANESKCYFDAVREILSPTCHEFGSLSSLWHEAGLDWHRVRERAQSLDEETGPRWETLANELQLVSAAARHSRGTGNPEHTARLYVAMRLLENRVISRVFRGFLFATSEDPNRQLLFPNLPVLHTYSTARGRCAKPWFTEMPEDGNSGVAEVSEPCVA